MSPATAVSAIGATASSSGGAVSGSTVNAVRSARLPTPIVPTQALTPAMALAGYTTHAARANGLADRSGTISVGKRADLTAFTVDPLAAPPDELAEAPIALTVVDGDITHRGAAA